MGLSLGVDYGRQYSIIGKGLIDIAAVIEVVKKNQTPRLEHPRQAQASVEHILIGMRVVNEEQCEPLALIG